MIDIIILTCVIVFPIIFIVVFSAIYIPYAIDKDFDHRDKNKNQEDKVNKE